MSRLIFGIKGTITGFSIGRLYFKNIQIFIDIEPHILAYLTNNNMVTVAMPDRLSEKVIISNSQITITKNDYNLSSFIGSKRVHYDKLLSDFESIADITDSAMSVFKHLAMLKFTLYLHSIFKLIEFHEYIKLDQLGDND